MSIRNRIARLEASFDDGEADGCDTCRDWPDAWTCLARCARDEDHAWAGWEPAAAGGYHCPDCWREAPTYGLSLVTLVAEGASA